MRILPAACHRVCSKPSVAPFAFFADFLRAITFPVQNKAKRPAGIPPRGTRFSAKAPLTKPFQLHPTLSRLFLYCTVSSRSTWNETAFPVRGLSPQSESMRPQFATSSILRIYPPQLGLQPLRCRSTPTSKAAFNMRCGRFQGHGGVRSSFLVFFALAMSSAMTPYD